MNIYLADLYHVFNRDKNPDTSPYTVPLGIGFLASALKRYVPSAETRLFRDPDKLLTQVRHRAPDLIGFSFCSWNTDLTRQVIAAVKAISPATRVVAGGPSVDDQDDAIDEFLRTVPFVDFVVPGEGESGLIALVRHLQESDADQPIPGVAYLAADGRLVRGRYERPIVAEEGGGERLSPKQVRAAKVGDIEITSPYLDGTLDEFLDDGLVPIVQTMRGCPYQCQFCVSGATEWNRMRGFPLDRITSEIDYALSRSRSKDLILTDENWGILGQRDVDLARHIMGKHEREGVPNRLYYYTAKVVTPASREIVELVSPIAWIAEFSMSFQSLNAETRKAIKRTNIGMDKLNHNVLWAKERKITTSSEMIYGFPHENPDTFFDGIETLAREGIDRVTIYPLQLFPGIDLASRRAREEFGFKTRFRLADCAYGVYDEGRIVAAESEEVVIANRWSSESDYLAVRRYAFFQQAMTGRQYFSDLIDLCRDLGIAFDPAVRYLTNADYSNHPTLARILAAHRVDAESELRQTPEDVRTDVGALLSEGSRQAGFKVNLVYLAKIVSSRPALSELLSLIDGYFDGLGLDDTTRCILSMFTREVLPHRIALLEPNPADRILFSTHFDYEAWRAGRIGHRSEYLRDRPVRYEAKIAPALKQNLREFDDSSHTDLQGIMDKTRKVHLRREIVAVESSLRDRPGASHTLAAVAG